MQQTYQHIENLEKKKWKLRRQTLLCVYYALVRSIMDYSSIIYPLLSIHNKKRIDSLQYYALRHCCKKPIKTSNSELLKASKTDIYGDRAQSLNNAYLVSCWQNENEFIQELVKQYLNWYPNSRTPKFKTFLCNHRNLVKDLMWKVNWTVWRENRGGLGGGLGSMGCAGEIRSLFK